MGITLSDWLNEPIFQRGRLELRRIDILLFILGCGIATHYWLFYGFQWAIIGVLMYVMVVMVCVWML